MVAVAAAQEADPAADLIKQLANDEYAVREAATKKLVELGDKAVPELEKALKSDDLEVRLRAGRALRAIQGKGPERKGEAKKPAPDRTDPLGPGGKIVGTSLSITKGKVKLKVTRIENGKRVTKEYEGTSIEELKKRHPELKDVLGNFRVTRRRDLKGLTVDMDKFWKDFNKDFGKGFDKDFWKTWQRDLEKEAARLREMSNRWRKQWEQQRGKDEWRSGTNRFANPWLVQRGTRLGVTAMKASPVLDAQLGLRGRGIVVATVAKNTPASRLGLQRYDILLELNGVAIRGVNDVAVALKRHKQGEKLTATVIRRTAETKLETK
jgi:hypothetical protein